MNGHARETQSTDRDPSAFFWDFFSVSWKFRALPRSHRRINWWGLFALGVFLHIRADLTSCLNASFLHGCIRLLCCRFIPTSICYRLIRREDVLFVISDHHFIASRRHFLSLFVSPIGRSDILMILRRDIFIRNCHHSSVCQNVEPL